MTAARPIVVAGGAGAVGALFTGLLRRDGHEVFTVDPVAAGPGAVAADVTAPTAAAAGVLRAARTVLLAVPEPVAVAAVPVLDTVLAPDALLVDTLSVKTAMAAAVAAHLSGRAALGVNPMFAPTLGLPGRPVAAVTYRPGPPVAGFLHALHRWGAQVVPVDADEHDRAAAVTQALTHATVLAFGVALAELDPPDAARAAAPPPHVLLRAVLARITAGAPAVYHDIQAANPHAARARAALRAALADLEAAAAAGPDAFRAVTERAGTALGADREAYRALCGRVLATLPPTAPRSDP